MKYPIDFKLIREINSAAAPLILSTLVSVLMGWIDQAFIGRISLYAYAGVGLVLSCINSLVGVLGAFSLVFNICGSKLSGKKESQKLNDLFSIFTILCLLIGLVLALFFNLFCDSILSKGFGLEKAALAEASTYLRIYSFSIPLNLLIFIHSSIIKIHKKSKYLLLCGILVNVINIFLDYVLVFGKFFFPALGTLGAALGTIAALAVHLLLYSYITRPFVHFSFQITDFWKKARNLLQYSLPFLAQEAMEDIVFVVGINSIVARMGVLELSAYNFIAQVLNFFLMPMFGYATANTLFVGEHYAQRKYQTIYKITKYTFAILMAWFVLLFLFLHLSSAELAEIITQNDGVKQLATAVLPTALLIQVFNYYLNICKSTLQCIGHEKWTLTVTFAVNLLTLAVLFLAGKTLPSVYKRSNAFAM